MRLDPHRMRRACPGNADVHRCWRSLLRLRPDPRRLGRRRAGVQPVPDNLQLGCQQRENADRQQDGGQRSRSGASLSPPVVRCEPTGRADRETPDDIGCRLEVCVPALRCPDFASASCLGSDRGTGHGAYVRRVGTEGDRRPRRDGRRDGEAYADCMGGWRPKADDLGFQGTGEIPVVAHASREGGLCPVR